MENLTQKVLSYQQTRQGLEGILQDLAPRIYRYPRRKMGWDEDACGDFYLFFQPRLVRLLTRFRDQGKPFESYLGSVMCWQLKNFARERRRSEKAWGVSLRLEDGGGLPEEGEPRQGEPPESPWEAASGPGPIGAPAPGPDGGETSCGCAGFPDPSDERILSVLESPSDRRNLLLLALKCIRMLPPERYPALAALTGMSEQRLGFLVEDLRAGMEPRERRLESFRGRRNRAFAQSLLLEADLAGETDSERRRDLSSRLARARRRMAAAIDRMSRVMPGPTNREIAAALGLPKGTVDSGLYWLKRKLAAVYDPPSRRLA
jgi:DNA-directed RNA polymerase specialized sigma24 family protein